MVKDAKSFHEIFYSPQPNTALLTVFPLVAPATDRDVCVCRSSACTNMQNINQSINQKRILINFQLVHMMKAKEAVSSELFLGRTWAKFGRSAPDSVGLVGNGRARQKQTGWARPLEKLVRPFCHGLLCPYSNYNAL